MKFVASILAVFAVSLVGCASEPSKPAAGGGKAYHLRVHQFEGCECDSVCPCVFSKDTTRGDCRGIMVWSVLEGRSGAVDLAGVELAAALTKSGANMEKAMGNWTGIIYVSDRATEAQKNAVIEVMKAEMGPAFAKVDVKTAPVKIKREDDIHEVTVGSVGTLKIKGLKNPAGKVTVLENPPSPIAPPKLWCAISETNSYDDGTTKWDFKGRNAFFTDMELKSK